MEVKAGILGFAVGDALGVPVEFAPREELEFFPVTDMQEFGAHKQPKGTWSDDTSMTLATMDGIIQSNGINYTQIANNFCWWACGKKYNAHDYVFDMGITTHKALQDYLILGLDPTKAGGKGYYDNGNGSLMRILPLAYYFKENQTSDLEMATIINNISSITHGHEISCMGCYLYTKYAMSLLEGKSFQESYNDLQKVDVSMYSDTTQLSYERILSGDLGKIKDSSLISSAGFVVSSLEASIWSCLNTNDYKEAVLKAVNLGEDTDTVCALAGGLAGIKYGYNDIPEKWLNTLVKKDYIEDLSNKFEYKIKNLNKIEKEKQL